LTTADAPDAIVVGSGPNGLAAAVTLGRAGLSVRVYEGAQTAGGGCRTEALTLPGFLHDVCSSVHPLLLASPFFRGLRASGTHVPLCRPEVAFAHPLDGSDEAVALHSVAETATRLGRDGPAYERVIAPLVEEAGPIVDFLLSPMRAVPRREAAAARFGLQALAPAQLVVRRFHTRQARALIGGAAAHATSPLTSPLSGGFGLLMTMTAHAFGWPFAEGGSVAIVKALVAEVERLGGEVVTGGWVRSLRQLPEAPAVLLDVTPRQLLALAGDRLPTVVARRMERFRYGPGVCKVDWALSGPVPWTAPGCRLAGTVHVCGTFEEIRDAEAAVAAGRHPERPYCIVAQPAVADPSRAPGGAEPLWGYCHVPSASERDMTAQIEAQIERFAPGFRDLVLARSVRTASEQERHDPNYVGGDINGGATSLRQTFFRPTVRWNPYRTGIPGVYLCSSSTPPGGGVHGMCGYSAARTALHDRFGGPAPFVRP
jgi:phytoene dehydrogenase-like protein